MATGGSPTLADDKECLVCKEVTKDLYELACGHSFCVHCVQRLARDNQQRNSVKCPSCRLITKLPECMENVLSKVTAVERPDVTRHCDLCEEKKVIAERHCFKCRKLLCKACLEKHKRLESTHETVVVTPYLFCATHSNEIVQLYCKACESSICAKCFFRDHSNHDTIELESIAKLRRERLSKFISDSEPSWKGERRKLEDINTALGKAKQIKSDFKDSAGRIQELIKKLDCQFENVKHDTETKLSAEIKRVEIQQAEVQDVCDSNERSLQRAKCLLEEASDQELVTNDIGILASQGQKEHDEGLSMELPTSGTTLVPMATQLEEMISRCEVEFRKVGIGAKKLHELENVATVEVGHTMIGLAIDVSNKRILARTLDKKGPIKVYDYRGHLQEEVGVGVVGLAHQNYNRGITIDTKRDCYVAVGEQCLLAIQRNGDMVKSIKVGKQGEGDVAYDDDGDVYVVTDCTRNTIYLVNPETDHVIRQFGSKGSGPTQFHVPCHMNIGHVTGLGGRHIIVSDYSNHAVKVFDMEGLHVKTYGTQGSGFGQLRNPGGVASDSDGRVIVCDFNNSRIVSFETDGGNVKWECIKTIKSWCMALDAVDSVLAVTNDANAQSFDVYS